MVADEVVETPYIVCKTTVLTVELIGNICSSIGCRHFGFDRLRRIPASRHSNGQLLGLTMSGMEIVKMHAINAIYWIRHANIKSKMTDTVILSNELTWIIYLIDYLRGFR